MKKKGIFCVHGFLENGLTSYIHFADYLYESGVYDYYLTDLQGHSIDEDINTFNYLKCIEKVTEEYKAYLTQYEEVYLIGFSMGGVIASYLASEFGCKKLVLVSPAFKYGQGSQILKDVIHMLHVAKEDENFSFRELIKADTNQRKRSIQNYIDSAYGSKGSSYENFMERLNKVNPTTFINFTRLVAKLRKKINITDLPVRIYHAEFDELVPLQSSLYIFNKIKSDNKRLILMSGVHHRILSSNVKNEVFEEILKFFFEDKIENKKLIA
ncbi:alpha/beta fold hydrolase [Mycoplasmatota bacterium WC44]